MDICLSYKANLASYNPDLSESQIQHSLPQSFIQTLSPVSLCASAAIVFMVEADGQRRKLGLPSRVTFLNKSSTEAEHQFNSTLDLRGQKKKKCIMIMAKVKVSGGTSDPSRA